MTLAEKIQAMTDTCRSLSNQGEKSRSLPDSETCPICHGDEWILKIIDGREVAVPCKCREKAVMRRRIHFAEIPDVFKDMTLKTFDLSVYGTQEGRAKARMACGIIKEYLNAFDEAKAAGAGLYIFSATKGSGKTRMAVSIANELMHNHNTAAKFATGTRILNEIRHTYDRETDMTESRLLDALATVDVLIIDDFGAEKVTDWVRDKFYEVINSRYVGKKVTIFTSNQDLKTLQYDDRITSRIKEMCYLVYFPEESVRDIIAENNMRKMMNRVTGGRNE